MKTPVLRTRKVQLVMDIYCYEPVEFSLSLGHLWTTVCVSFMCAGYTCRYYEFSLYSVPITLWNSSCCSSSICCHCYYPRWHSHWRGYCVQSRLSVCALTGKRFELSTPNLVHIYSSCSACIDPKVKGEGHTVTKTSRHMVASDHCPFSASQYAAVLPAAIAGVDLHVDITAYVF